MDATTSRREKKILVRLGGLVALLATLAACSQGLPTDPPTQQSDSGQCVWVNNTIICDDAS